MYQRIISFSLVIMFPVLMSAQFYVSPGSTFYVSAGSSLYVDSLVIQPTAALSLSNVTIDKTYVPVTNSAGSSISKVYFMNAPVTVTGTVGMFVANSELNGNTLSALEIAYDPGPGFITTTGSVVNTNANYVSHHFATAVTLEKATAINSGVVLPVKLVDFNAIAEGRKARLTWSTTLEENTDHFIIERSADGETFVDLMKEKSKNSNSRATYVVYDNNPNAGINYYRIAEIDKAGVKTYYGTRIVRFEEVTEKISLILYPNPASDRVFVECIGRISQNAWLSITDISGKQLLKISFDKQKISIDLSQYPPGLYFANYSDDKERLSFKIDKL